MDLVLDIGNFQIKGALFDGDRPTSPFVLPHDVLPLEEILEKQKVETATLSSTHSPTLKLVKEILEKRGIPFSEIDFSTVKVHLDVDEPQALGPDRIANVYGALFRFPQNDCIVVDMGTAVTFDYVGCEGRYGGGAIYPGVTIEAKALASYTDKLPEVELTGPVSPLARTTKTHIQSGLYFGLLGAIERILFEMRKESKYEGEIKIVATGGIFRQIEDERFVQAVLELVDLIDPALTLIGIHEIMKEMKKDV